MATDENQWRTPSFRQSVVAKIDEAVARSGMPTAKNSMEMENHVFQKAKTKEEYLGFVARLILHVREMKSKNPGNMGGPGVQGQMIPDPINALQTLARQGTGNNQMMGLGPGDMPGGPSGMVRQPQPQNTGGNWAMSNQMQSMNAPMGGQMNPPLGGPGQMNTQLPVPNQMNPQMGGPGQMNPQLGGPGQMNQQLVGPGQMNQQLGGPGQMNPQLGGPGQMNPQLGGPGQMNPQLGGPGQMNPQLGVPGQMGGQMQGPGQMNMGIGGQMHSQLNHMQPRKPGEMMLGNQQGFLGRNVPPGNFMRQSPPLGSQPVMAASPALVPSPSGPQLTPVRSNISMAASPSNQLNTPGQAVPTPSPSTLLEEQQYREKVRQLSKYIEPLRRMIAKMGNDDVEKLMKMKKLLEILSNPSKRMPLETLLKCEVVLEKMDLKRGEGSVGPHTGHFVTTMHNCNPLLEAVSNCLQNSVNNHTLQRTFGPTLEALFGPEIKMLPAALEAKPIDDVKSDIPEVLQGEIARLDQRFKVGLDPSQQAGSKCVRLLCWLDDKNLPCVPPISISIPEDYPRNPPKWNTSQCDYNSTDFLMAVHKALSLRIRKLPSRFSLSQLLDTWEMSVRQASAPSKKLPSTMSVLMAV